MSSNRTPFRRVAVLGAGVMGAQIAAHLANVGVEVLLFELAAKEGWTVVSMKDDWKSVWG